jgi:hypothetical protein
MWRKDPLRSAVSSDPLPETLHLNWVLKLPPLKPAFWQIRQERLQFDLGYEPVVAGKTMVLGSSRSDSVTAYNTDSGTEIWRFYADAPVRLAPAIWENKVFFVSDDGCLYCLAAESGKRLWMIRGAPSVRKVMGNDRLISVWAARGGPVADQGRVYFAAGIWPFEGTFIHAVDARTGEMVWTNDRLGSRYAAHPHEAMSFGGPSPQGYLMIHNGRLVIPSSRAYPAFLSLQTGELLSFEFGHDTHGTRPGSWFVVADPEGALAVDPKVNAEQHDEGMQIIGQIRPPSATNAALQATMTIGKETYKIQAGLAGEIQVGRRKLRFEERLPGLEGTVHNLLAADGKLFAVTREGSIYCYSGKATPGKQLLPQVVPLAQVQERRLAAQALLAATGVEDGYALVWGLPANSAAESLALQSQLNVIAVDQDPSRVEAYRRRLDQAGIYGEKMSVHAGNPLAYGWPAYLASLILCEDLAAGGFALQAKDLAEAYTLLRPYGGTLCLKLSPTQHADLATMFSRANLPGARLVRTNDYSLVIRAGAIPGAADYVGQPNYDEEVKSPLGLLWFGDTYHHHKLFYQGVTPDSGRGLPSFIRVIDGVMSYWVTEPFGTKPPSLAYPLVLQKFNAQMHIEAFADVYTGRNLSNGPTSSKMIIAAGTRPNAIPLTRKNPITGADEAREYVKNHGCDLYGADYGNLITMRSGTAAFYDKRSESGTINISGMRSGCRNSVIPACGVLSLPSWTGNCSCNYPIFTSLAMVPMPESFEQWTAWGGVAQDGPVERVGINFGAPGDRMSSDGTLWLDWPRVGGPSPDLQVQVTPENIQPFYRHSLWMQGGQSLPWIFSSGIQAVQRIRIPITIRGANPSGPAFSARWTGFIKIRESNTNLFHVRSDGAFRLWIDGVPVLDSGRPKSGETPKEVTGRLVVENAGLHSLHAEYLHPANASAKPAFVELSWSTPSHPKEVIPPDALVTPNGRPGGLAGVYFANAKANGPGVLQVDPKIQWEWGDQKPAILRQTPVMTNTAGRAYTVRLVFAEPEKVRLAERVFSVKLQGQTVLNHFDILKEAGGINRGILREFRGIKAADAVEIEFVPAGAKPSLICGVEMIAEK